MKSILVVEDTRLFSNMLKKKLEGELDLEVVVATTLAEARTAIGERPERFYMALLDLNLPDAPKGEVVDEVTGRGIPGVVFTGTFDPEVREEMAAKPRIIDYVVKESPASLDYVVSLARRIDRNRQVKVMVVDDSRSTRTHIHNLLRNHLYQVVEAENGVQALRLLQEHRDIQLIVTDYTMPEMDGFELVKQVRQRHPKNQLAIIGISAYGNQLLSARFIKNGANDFINKPFLEEEFYCRVTQNIEMLEYIQALRDVSVRDFLTGLHNRRYFFENGEHLFASARRGQLSLAVAMVDVDHFKKVNDTYGHDAGDAVIRQVASILKDQFRQTDVVARFGGEEFCVLMVNLDPGSAPDLFEHLREVIATEEIAAEGKIIRITASIGVCGVMGESLQAMINHADELLYQAKSGGRNRVVMELEP